MGPRTSLAVVTAGALALAGCGGGAHFANHARPAVPLQVSVYINDQRVSVSPDSVSPGLVTLTITNQSSNAASLDVGPAGASKGISTTGPISPQGTDQLTLNLATGSYTVAVAPGATTEASTAAPPGGILPGALQVQGQRPSANNQLLQP